MSKIKLIEAYNNRGWKRAIPDNMKCTFCSKVLRDAVQTPCGCRYCRQCVEEYIKQQKTSASNYNTTIAEGAASNIEHDIHSFASESSGIASGIQSGTVRSQETMEFQTTFVNCIGKSDECSQTILTLESILPDNAANKEINQLFLKCYNEGCDFQSKLKEMVEHCEICKYREINCNRCGQVYQRAEENKHLTNLCPNRMVNCPNCNGSLMYYQLESSHLSLSATSNIFDLCDQFKTDCLNCDEKNVMIKTHLLEKCPNKPVKCLFEKLSNCHFMGTKDQLLNHLLSEGKEHIDVYHDGVIKNRKMLQQEIQTLKEENKTLLSMVNELNTTIENLAQTQSLVTASQSTSTSTVAPQVKTSIPFRNGKFIWHVQNFSSLQAKANKVYTVLSDPFYTSEFGYKMCLKIYPLGDGPGQNTHLSVFFTIMKGEYDNILSWPFNKKIVLSLLDQKGTNNTKTDVFRPDVNSPCYKQPENQYNIASGSPKFITLTELQKFIDKDSFYIKIEVL